MDWRIEWLRKRSNWSLPWINQIVLLKQGVILLTRWSINGKVYPAYLASNMVTNSGNDSYSFMWHNLLVSLRFGDAKSEYERELPGLSSLNANKTVKINDGKNLMILPDPNIEIATIGNLKKEVLLPKSGRIR